MDDYNIKLVGLGVVLWATAFLLIRNILPKRSFEFCNRLVSTIHATLAVTLALLSVEEWRCPVCPLASKSSPRQMQTLAITVAYMIYDLVCCLFDKKDNLDNMVHHLVSIVGLGAGLAYEKCGSELVAAIWITEISSPFLHLRELLKELRFEHNFIRLYLKRKKKKLTLAVLNWSAIICSHILFSKNGMWALSHFCNSISQQSSRNQGNGSWTAASEYFLVLQNSKDGEIQARQMDIQKSCLMDSAAQPCIPPDVLLLYFPKM
ncbi:hypothetical protein Patl1_09205 [Pistacia atlantica]|uniref:Uncharacterized protein n=1 Tax=Pistacia atlantica TaxID=434234 RepID=A0ACC1AEF8_9ROSI|nr:hypothetical protein Patl1_09205 [Pistacia atlantica]